MKLRPLYNQLLTEIGDSIQIPPGVSFSAHSTGGNVKFNYLEDDYEITIKFPIKQGNKLAVEISFGTRRNKQWMTNKNQPLKIMSYIVGCVEEFLKRYAKKYDKVDNLEIVYIKFNPETEDSTDTSSEGNINRRDRLYKAYINNFAKRYESTVSWSSSGGIIAKFNPPLIIK